MNFQLDWAAIQPFLTQLLTSPQFQVLLQKIFADMNAKIASGVHPVVAAQQGQGQMLAAAQLHLTGNPISDAQAWLANFRPSTGGPTSPPGTFTS